MTNPRFLSSFQLRFKRILLLSSIWTILTFVFVLACQVFLPDEQPLWYRITLIFFEEGALLFASYLCWRNWRFSSILSDRKIWLFFALGLIVEAASHFTYYFWEQILKGNPDFSLANWGYFISYTLLVLGMIFAVKFRAIDLSVWQWIVLSEIAFAAIWLVWYVGNPLEASQTLLEVSVQGKSLPAWVFAIEKSIAPIAGYINLYLVVADVAILVLTSTLLINFWGGRFSQTWLAIAFGGLWLYIADTLYAYAIAKSGFFATGIIDSFWTFSAIFFCLGATWEYETSTHPRRRRL
jgi:hypothetical protein